MDTNVVTKADNFCAPVERYKRGEKKGEYKMKSGETVYLCFSSDFLLPDADQWRSDCQVGSVFGFIISIENVL